MKMQVRPEKFLKEQQPALSAASSISYSVARRYASCCSICNFYELLVQQLQVSCDEATHDEGVALVVVESALLSRDKRQQQHNNNSQTCAYLLGFTHVTQILWLTRISKTKKKEREREQEKKELHNFVRWHLLPENCILNAQINVSEHRLWRILSIVE